MELDSDAELPSVRILEASHNRFALYDGFDVGPLEDPGSLALVLGRHDEFALDGLLQLLPPSEGGACRMVIHNIDGSRSEACGNGLRCVAKLAVELGRVEGPRFEIETDAGTRQAELQLEAGKVVGARVSMGQPRLVESERLFGLREGEVSCTIVDMGNPHCILFLPDLDSAPVASLGEQLEAHPAFPERTNVEFVDARKDRLLVRIWERGVGETRSCGSGAAAAAVAAIGQARLASPVRVVTPGGELTIEWQGEELWLTGPVGDVEGIQRIADLC